jgi:hypothetical protein
MPPIGKVVYCNFPFSRLKISESGDVKHCCYQKGYLGNVFDQDILELWNSRLTMDVRNSIYRGELHSLCRSEACPFMYTQFSNHFGSVEPLFPSSYPRILELDLPNTHCNIGGLSPTPETACFMCPRAAVDFVASEDVTDRIIDRIRHLTPHIDAFQVAGIAESFWKGRIFEVLEGMGYSAYRDKINVIAYTNGTLFDDVVQRRWIDTVSRSRLSFSLDAATEETYFKIRRARLYGRVVENIRRYMAVKPVGHVCVIQNNLNLLNVGEAVRMVEVAANLGVSLGFTLTLTCSGVENTMGLVQDGNNVGIFESCEREVRLAAQELGVELHFQRSFLVKSSRGRIPLC